MKYDGPSKVARVRITAKDGWLAAYQGQECDATFYMTGMGIHLNTEQLNPPLAKWQTAFVEDVERI